MCVAVLQPVFEFVKNYTGQRHILKVFVDKLFTLTDFFLNVELFYVLCISLSVSLPPSQIIFTTINVKFDSRNVSSEDLYNRLPVKVL